MRIVLEIGHWPQRGNWLSPKVSYWDCESKTLRLEFQSELGPRNESDSKWCMSKSWHNIPQNGLLLQIEYVSKSL